LNIYLDTNAFRYFGIAFEKVSLAPEITEKILISPLSAFEVFAQLGDDNPAKADLVLRQIHALRNWTNPKHAVLLPWPGDMLQMLWSQKPVHDDDLRERMQQSFNVILTAVSLTPLKEAALQQKQMMDLFKDTMAHDFKNMLDDLKTQQGKKEKQKAKPVDTSEPWFNGIAKRAKADPSSKTISEVRSLLSAYHEFEQTKLSTALLNKEYNPLSHTNQNDIIDSEQLIYLGEPSLCMLTADKGIKSKVVKSEQAARIVVATPEDLRDAQKAEAVLRSALGI
jgi:predicted transcriptional regulator